MVVSTKLNQGYLLFTEDEEAAYQLIYSHFGYTDFDPVPPSTCQFSQYFKNHYPAQQETRDVPTVYQGNINASKLMMLN